MRWFVLGCFGLHSWLVLLLFFVQEQLVCGYLCSRWGGGGGGVGGGGREGPACIRMWVGAPDFILSRASSKKVLARVLCNSRLSVRG